MYHTSFHTGPVQHKAFDAVEDVSDALGKLPVISVASGIARIAYGIFKLFTALLPISYKTVFEGKSFALESNQRFNKAILHIYRGAIEATPTSNWRWNSKLLDEPSKMATQSINREG